MSNHWIANPQSAVDMISLHLQVFQFKVQFSVQFLVGLHLTNFENSGRENLKMNS